MEGLGCYKCSSINNDTGCIDPFNPGLTDRDYYQDSCFAGVQNRVGLFPALYCLKVGGIIGSEFIRALLKFAKKIYNVCNLKPMVRKLVNKL
jgi:hypothetical protein